MHHQRVQEDDPFMRADDLASRIDRAKRSGDNYTGRCPGHQDEQASLSWTNGTHSLLITCHAGCPLERIARALGLTVQALLHDGFPERERPSKGAPIVAEYPYVSAGGQLQYVVVRRADKTFFQKRPDPAEPGKWIHNIRGITPLLYKLDTLQGHVEVDIVEGEADVHSLDADGIVATTCSGGAGKWKEVHTQQLIAAGCQRVNLYRDRTGPGPRTG
jgi:putative DNA primase/helicase